MRTWRQTKVFFLSLRVCATKLYLLLERPYPLPTHILRKFCRTPSHLKAFLQSRKMSKIIHFSKNAIHSESFLRGKYYLKAKKHYLFWKKINYRSFNNWTQLENCIRNLIIVALHRGSKIPLPCLNFKNLQLSRIM